jgi:2-polyprenyl-6-methoxyphenol hydroxylase-like FAD-dependent oxidoreductase
MHTQQPRPDADTTVLIVGAGPSGLTAALILTMARVPFRIVDKKAGPVEETRALIVHAKTLELWDKLGLAQQAIADGQRIGAIQMLREGRPAGTVTFLDTGADERTAFPFALSYAQNQTEHMLVNRLEALGGRVEWNTEVLSLSQTTDRVLVHLQRADNGEEILAANWVVGADGARSPVRHALNLELKGDTYEQTLFLADVDLEWAFAPGQVVFDLTRAGFSGFFTIPGGDKRYRLLGSLAPALARKTTLTLDDLQQQIRDTSTLDVRLLNARWITIYRIHHRMAEQFRIGRVFLVGDAAHIHSPAGGQGMNTGIGDAYNLAWKLALVATGQAYETLLDSYTAERMPFARTILNGSDRGFTAAVTTNPMGRRIKLVAVPLFFRLLSSRAIFKRQAFWYLSQLWTRYHTSPAIAETGRTRHGPQAGDRAPDGEILDGAGTQTRLLSLLTGLEHHLLLFEGANPTTVSVAALDATTALVTGYAAPIRTHRIRPTNRKLHQRYGATSASLFLVRPDGQIAYRGAATDLDSLRRFLDRFFVARAAVETAARAALMPPLV